MARPEREVNLAEAALLIAARVYPGLDVAGYLKRLDEMALAAGGRLKPSPSLPEVVGAINEQLIGVQGFTGNTEEFSDPRNSFLNEVIDRKLGIPITLSLIYMSVGERLGVSVRGISFPGHFLVGFGLGGRILIVDPFFGGIVLDREALVDRMQRFIPDEAGARKQLVQVLSGAPKTEVVARVLRNLKEVYLARDELENALMAAEQILSVTPGNPLAWKDRAQLYARLDCGRAAAEDYLRYLELAPDAPDASTVHAEVAALRSAAPRLN